MLAIQPTRRACSGSQTSSLAHAQPSLAFDMFVLYTVRRCKYLAAGYFIIAIMVLTRLKSCVSVFCPGGFMSVNQLSRMLMALGIWAFTMTCNGYYG